MLETGANIATIFLILEFLVVMLLTLAVVVVLARATLLMRRKVQQVMPSVQYKARQLSTTSESVSQKVAEPFIRLEQSQARFRAMRQRAFGAGPAQPGSQRQGLEEE